MIELQGEKVVLRTLERDNCRELWAAYEPAEPLPTEPLNPGLSVEGADDWFEDMTGSDMACCVRSLMVRMRTFRRSPTVGIGKRCSRRCGDERRAE